MPQPPITPLVHGHSGNVRSMIISVKYQSMNKETEAQNGEMPCLSWTQLTLCCGGHPVHWRMLSCIPNLYLLEATSTPVSRCDNLKCLQTFPDVTWEVTLPQVRTIELTRGKARTGNEVCRLHLTTPSIAFSEMPHCCPFLPLSHTPYS